MLNYETNSGKGWIENQWEELTPRQFINVVSLTNKFVTGAITDIDEYRLRILEMLTGYKRKRKRSKHAEQINENLYRISENLNFAVLPDIGPDEVFEFFSPELRELLKTRFPWEIYVPEHRLQMAQVKDIMKVSFKINFNLKKNLLPFLKDGNSLFKGFLFSTSDGDIDTDIKAWQYLEASECFNAFVESGNEKYMRLMMKTLYPTKDYVDWRRRELINMDEIPDISDPATLDALSMVFIYIQQTFATDPVFGILFTRNETTGFGKISLGSDEAIGQLVEAGYGSHSEVSELDICTFFNYQLMFIRKNIETLKGMNKKPGEISRILNLPVDIIQKL